MEVWGGGEKPQKLLVIYWAYPVLTNYKLKSIGYVLQIYWAYFYMIIMTLAEIYRK